MELYYAGIGSRQTPLEILTVMRDLASALDKLGYTLRSGGAAGADQAFFEGLPSERRHTAQIFLPGSFFQGQSASSPGFIDATQLPSWGAAMATVNQYHPRPEKLGAFARTLMARNAMQLLGPNLNEPAEFIVAWTPGGQVTGGTGQALRMAADLGIKVRNLGDSAVLQRAVAFLSC